MIKNEFQYEVTQEWVEKFSKSIMKMEQDEEAKRKDFQKWEVSRGVLQYHLDQLNAEIAEYERLINCDNNQPIEIAVNFLNELPDVLIKARMAAKISEKELAEIIGVEEERIKHFEKRNYGDATFGEMLDVIAALGVELAKPVMMQVDFEEVEIAKRITEKRRQKNMKTVS
ncbi:MAG: helix-turn-helix transcriptional regulator [Hormoscilla sp. GM102CHS1]|nr:helix-turn-helix transcriptional regulator [Hormoscilla sp. GM102CHS1]